MCGFVYMFAVVALCVYGCVFVVVLRCFVVLCFYGIRIYHGTWFARLRAHVWFEHELLNLH